MQVGTPGELYHRPNSAFVADFIGHTNLLSGRIIERNHQTVRIDTPAGRVLATSPQSAGLTDGNEVTLSIRPEQMRIARRRGFRADGTDADNYLVGKTVETTFLGEASEHVLLVNDAQRLTIICAPPLFDVPEQMAVEFDPEDVVVLPGALLGAE